MFRAMAMGLFILALPAKPLTAPNPTPISLTDEEKIHLSSRWDLGYYLFERQQFAAAAQEFEKIRPLMPGNSSLLALIGSCYTLTGRWEAGEVTLLQALEQSPQDPDINALLGQLYSSMGTPLKGIAFMEKALQMMPDEVDLRARLANIYLDEQKPHLAFGHLDLILKSLGTRTFENVELDFAFARCLLQFGNEKLAHTFAEKAYQADPGNSQYAYILGMCLFASKAYHEAARILGQVNLETISAMDRSKPLDISGERLGPELLLQLGEAQFLDKDWEAAEKTWWAGCKRFPSSYALYSRLVEYYISIAMPNRAQNLIQFAESKNPQHPGNLLLQVQQTRKLSEYAASWKSLERLKRQSCGKLSLDALWEEAQLNFLTGKNSACHKLLDQLLVLKPYQADAHVLKAKLALQAGDRVSAQIHFGEAKKSKVNTIKLSSLNAGWFDKALLNARSR